jgi:hypothetical protein
MHTAASEMLLNHWVEKISTWSFLDFTEDQIAGWISFMTPDVEHENPGVGADAQREMAGAYLALSQKYNFFAYQSFLAAGQALLASSPDDADLAVLVEKFGKRVGIIGSALTGLASGNGKREEFYRQLFRG